MKGRKNKQESSKKDEENDPVVPDKTLFSTPTDDDDDDPALRTDSEASEGENEITNENEKEKNDDEPDGKPDKKRNKKVINEESDGETDNEKIDKQKVQHMEQNMEHNAMYIFATLVLILGASIFFYTSFPTDDINLEDSLVQLANDFQNQSPGSFKKLKSRVMPYIHHTTSPRPFVLLVASTHDNQFTADCFATRVAKIIATSSVAINGSNYWAKVSDDVKKDIDNRLRDVFSEGKFPTVAIIHNLDLIPYGTTNLFYAYCDHDNPMYKEAAIIFTITLPQDYQISDDEVKREGLVEKYLSEHSSWAKDQNFSIDVMGALISRITDTVIVVNKESNETLQKFCWD